MASSYSGKAELEAPEAERLGLTKLGIMEIDAGFHCGRQAQGGQEGSSCRYQRSMDAAHLFRHPRTSPV